MTAPARTGQAGAARRPARLALVPAGSPRRAAVKPLGVAPLGTPVLVGVSVPDARHHLHVLGPTGTGKSTLLVNLVLAEARAGRGVAVFDPKGDLIRDLLHRLPESAGRRLVLIDPDEQQAPPALNLLGPGADPEAVADQVAGVMAKVWAQYWGPRTDDLARHAVLTLACLPGATLADLPVLLADPAYRHRVLARVRRTADPAMAAGRRDAYGIVARLVIDGRDSEPFSLHTRPAPPPWPGRAETLRAAARARGLPAADRQALAEARRLGPAARRLPAGPATPEDSGEPDTGQVHSRQPRAAETPTPPVPIPPPRDPAGRQR